MVIASDNGQPSLSATQTFQGTVKDALPGVVVSLGQTNLFSGIVNASVNAAQVTRDTGSGVANTAGTLSRIVVVGRRPVLLPGTPPPVRTLLRYGRPGASYQIECTTNLGAAAVWSLVGVTALSNIVQTVAQPPTPGTAFYRVRALTGGATRIAAQSGGPNLGLLLQGTAGETFQLQTTTNLGPGANWQTIATIGLSNAFQSLNLPKDGARERFYRLKTP